MTAQLFSRSDASLPARGVALDLAFVVYGLPHKRKKLTDSLAAEEAPALVYPATKVGSVVVRADMESASPMRQSLQAAGKLPRGAGSSLEMILGNQSIAMTQKPMIIGVRIKPNARVSQLSQEESGQWLAQIKSLPVDGKANAALIGLVAKHFACRKAAVSIKTGSAGRMKLVKIEAPYVLEALGFSKV